MKTERGGGRESRRQQLRSTFGNEQRTALIFLSSLCHVLFFSHRSLLSFFMCCTFLCFLNCLWLFKQTNFNMLLSFLLLFLQGVFGPRPLALLCVQAPPLCRHSCCAFLLVTCTAFAWEVQLWSSIELECLQTV